MRIAAAVHTGLDRGGSPAIMHPLAVMCLVMRAYQDFTKRGEELPFTLEEAMITALLHDAYEDHPDRVTLTLVRDMFGHKIMLAIEAVSRRTLPDGSKETYRAFIMRVKHNALARFVKARDLSHNLSRVKLLPLEEQDIKRRWHAALGVLTQRFPYSEN